MKKESNKKKMSCKFNCIAFYVCVVQISQDFICSQNMYRRFLKVNNHLLLIPFFIYMIIYPKSTLCKPYNYISNSIQVCSILHVLFYENI